MKFYFSIFILTTLFFLSSCKKESEQKCDWQLVDNAGNYLNIVYNKTEAELLACTDCGTFNGGQPGTPLGQMLTPCNYFSSCDPKFCWIIGNHYWENTSEKFVNCFFSTATKTKVICNSCGNWYTRKKMTYIPSNSTLYSNVSLLRAYCGDTATRFNSGSQFIIKQTADSLILLQYSKDGTVWN